MATVNLGSIKFNWKGSYSGATAYVVDDVVESSGSSYICIAATTGNAPPNATYWEQMSSAGTDGTDLTTTLTTQGDIVYRDASGLARLGAGTSGQALVTNGTGANPSWGDVSGGLVQTSFNYKTDVFSSSTTGSWYDITGLNVTLSSVGATSHKAIGNFGFAWGTHTSDTVNAFRIRKTIDGGSTYTVLPNHVHGSTAGGAATFQSQTVGLRSMLDNNGGNYTNLPFWDNAIGTTGNVTYQVQSYRLQTGTFYINRTSSDSTTYGRGSANFWVMEVKV